MRAAPDIFIGWYICYFIDQRGSWSYGGRQSEFEHRSLIDSIYCYCTVCLHDSVACGQNLSNEREFYQLHMLRLTKLSGG
jgi:hypothetical protein